MSENELVSVLVPKRHLPKVYGLIAELEGVEGTPQQSPPSDSPTGASDDWTSSRVQRMVSESPPAMRDILRAMAERPDQWVTVHQLAEAITGKDDATWNTVAGTMGAFGRRIKNRYGITEKPYEDRYDHTQGCKVFRMSKDMADQVISALKNGR